MNEFVPTNTGGCPESTVQLGY